jgi:phosphohistidine phosphatase SixA
VTILADNDQDGRRHARTLATNLEQRSVELKLIVLSAQARVSTA